MNFTRSLNTACYNYIPKNLISTQISYFIASETKIILYKKWNSFTQKDMNITIVEGSHFSIFKQPNVRQLYKKFEVCFNEIDKKILFEAKY